MNWIKKLFGKKQDDAPREETPRERVTKGARLLDEKNLGWFNKINIAELNIWSPVHCIIGQLYRSMPLDDSSFLGYSIGLEALGIEAGSDYGFCPKSWNDEESTLIEGYWKEEIAKRKAA